MPKQRQKKALDVPKPLLEYQQYQRLLREQKRRCTPQFHVKRKRLAAGVIVAFVLFIAYLVCQALGLIGDKHSLSWVIGGGSWGAALTYYSIMLYVSYYKKLDIRPPKYKLVRVGMKENGRRGTSIRYFLIEADTGKKAFLPTKKISQQLRQLPHDEEIEWPLKFSIRGSISLTTGKKVRVALHFTIPQANWAKVVDSFVHYDRFRSLLQREVAQVMSRRMIIAEQTVKSEDLKRILDDEISKRVDPIASGFDIWFDYASYNQSFYNQ